MVQKCIKSFVCFLIVAAFVSCTPMQEKSSKVVSTNEYNTEFEMPDVFLPEIPDYSINIKDFGAIADGKTLNTKAFSDAIAHLENKGGGKLIVPEGIWYTGPITLKGNINIHTERGALVLFSGNFDDYPLIKTSFEGLNTYRCMSPINAVEASNIAFTGSGVFDGNGSVWRPVKKSKMTESQWKNLLASGGVLTADKRIWYPTEKALRGATNTDFNVPKDRTTKEDFEDVKDFLRPVMVSLIKCDKVLFDGPTFQNSPAWNIHPLMCTNFIMRNVTVRNPWYSQNGDGLDLESCKNAIIENCNFDVGDDAICFKSGKDQTGRDRGMPTENVIVKDCIVYHGHGGFVIGSEMSGGVRNVQVSNCTFIGTDVGLRFKSKRGRGGLIENIYISDINMINIANDAIRFNLYYAIKQDVWQQEQTAKTPEELMAIIPGATEQTPEFRNIYMKNINCKGANRAISMQGLPEKNLNNIHMTNISISAKYGVSCADAEDIQFKNIDIKVEEGPGIYLKNVKNTSIEGFTCDPGAEKMLVIEGFFNKEIKINAADFESTDKQIEVVSQADQDVLIVN